LPHIPSNIKDFEIQYNGISVIRQILFLSVCRDPCPSEASDDLENGAMRHRVRAFLEAPTKGNVYKIIGL
jgi:hypothetical protein